MVVTFEVTTEEVHLHRSAVTLLRSNFIHIASEQTIQIVGIRTRWELPCRWTASVGKTQVEIRVAHYIGDTAQGWSDGR